MAEGKTIVLPAQDVPVSGEVDVVVCGGGPAGIGAAVAAARGGARTLLVEWLSSLGGIATGAFIGAWMDSPGGLIFDELFQTQISLAWKFLQGRWDMDCQSVPAWLSPAKWTIQTIWQSSL